MVYVHIYLYMCTYIYHKRKKTYIPYMNAIYHNRNFSLTDLNSSESDPCSWSGFLSYSWAMAAYFHSATCTPKKTEAANPTRSGPTISNKSLHQGWNDHKRMCFFFAFFFVKLLNQKDTSCCNRSSEIKSKKTLPFRFFSGVGGRSIQIFDFD